MSLHHIAKQLESHGRGNDTELVHVSKNEMQGLQALAHAKGGSLTRNPHTGLYEAGFLEDILPVVAAGAAMYFTAGAATPLVMGATGLGATGAGILAGAGAGALISGGMAAIQGKDVGNAALMGGVAGGIGGGIGAPGEVPTGGQVNAEVLANASQTNLPVQASNTALTGAANVNPATGQLVDPFAGLAGTTPTAGATPGSSGLEGLSPNVANAPGYMQSAPNPNNLTPQQLAEQTQAFTGDVAGYTPPKMSAADAMTKQQMDAVAAAKADPNSSWWSKQTPWEKAGYATAGTGILAAMNQQRGAMPTTNPADAGAGDYLKRISPNFQAQQPIQPNPYYRAKYPTYAAEGGIMRLAAGGMPGPVEQMTQNMMGGQGNMYPQSQQEHTNFATPTQMPASAEVIRSDYDAKTNPYTGVMMAEGGIANLGSYSDGGRLLKGPGDGVSDNIPATIGGHQPARLADGEFVVPARIVSELGNGSTDAGAKRLYAMMERVQAKRKKSMGKGKFAVNSKAEKDLPV